MGNTGGGHYISFVNRNGEWYCCNDDRISKENNIDKYINNSYMYFYVRVKC